MEEGNPAASRGHPKKRFMNKLRFFALVGLLGFGLASIHAQTPRFPVIATLSETEQKKANQFLAGKTGNEDFSYASPLIDSDGILGVAIAFRAMALGGLNPEFRFVTPPNSARERELVKTGEVMMAGSLQWDYWFEKLGDSVYQSSVVVKNGQTEKGLYSTVEKAKTYKLKVAKDLAGVSVATSKNWVIDWGTVERLGFKTTIDAQNRTSMFRMVQGDRADVTLQAFSSSPDMSIEDSGVKLVPIEGIKVALTGNRSFMVSRSNANGERVFSALQKGLAVMRSSKEIDRALRESGFLNLNVKDWTLLKAQ